MGDRGAFSKEEFPWQGKREINGHTEIGAWMSSKLGFPATISYSMRTLYRLGDGDVFSKEEFHLTNGDLKNFDEKGLQFIEKVV